MIDRHLAVVVGSRADRRLSRRLRILAAVAVLAFVASACGSTSPALPAEVVQSLNVADNSIADLTSPGAEEVPRLELLQAALAARSAGTELRFVVAGVDQQLVSAESVVDAYGGTALSYKANDSTFEAASRDMSSAQLDRALAAAGAQGDMGDSAGAFVSVIEEEGIDSPGIPIGRWLLIIALILAALFMVVQAMSYWRARKRRLKRQREFLSRKQVLHDWASQLGPEIEAVAPAATSAGGPTEVTLLETKDFVTSILPKIENATNLGELDQAEMRIGRVAIKLRDMRRALNL